MFPRLVALLIGGALLTEAAGYIWHRWACHVGIFRSLFKDILRRRHFDHHINKYAGAGLRSDIYHQSCDIAFKVLGIGLALALMLSALMGWLHLNTAAALLLGVVIHAFVGTRLHALYHLSDHSCRRLALLRFSLTWKAFSWLRDFHDVHHVANANYSLVCPVFDVIGKTYISPEKLPQLRTENLFPRFDPAMSSSCETSLFS